MAQEPHSSPAPKVSFKGWSIPGPPVSGSAPASPPTPEVTLDALSGHFKIFQLQNGHRFSTDDLLVAWYGTSWCPSPRTILELGSGIGTISLIAAWRSPAADIVAIEAQKTSTQLFARSLIYNDLAEKIQIRTGDFRDPQILHPAERFDLVLGSPPYFPPEAGLQSDHPQKVACRFELRGDIRDYCKVAHDHLAPGGIFACVFPIHPAGQEHRVQKAARETNLTIVRSRPVVLKEGDQPLISVFVMMRAEHLPEPIRSRTWHEPALTIRKADGSVHEEYQAIKLAIGFPP